MLVAHEEAASMQSTTLVDQFNSLSDRVHCETPGIAAGLVELDLKQLKEYFSKLKFTFIEIRAKEFFLQKLFAPNSSVGYEATVGSEPEHADKTELKTIKTAIEGTLQDINQKCRLVCNLQQEGAALIEKIQQFQAATHDLQTMLSCLMEKSYPDVQFFSVEEAMRHRNDLESQICKCELSIQQLHEDIDMHLGSVAIAKQRSAELEREEAEYATKSSEALNARKSGNQEAQIIHRWLQEMQTFSSYLMCKDKLQVHWEECAQDKVSFTVAEMKVVATIDPVDYTVQSYTCYKAGKGPTTLDRFPVEKGDPLGLFVCELIEYQRSKK